jgi:hypothetical protein
VPKEFMLFTDRIALKYVNTQKKLNNRHAKWVSFLQGYTFIMKHKSRRKNQVAVALSQCTILLKTMENKVIGFSALKDLYASDNDFWEILEQLKNPVVGNMDLTQGEYFMQYGYLFKGKQQCIPIGSTRENNIRELHSSGLVDHFGKDKMLALI